MNFFQKQISKLFGLDKPTFTRRDAGMFTSGLYGVTSWDELYTKTPSLKNMNDVYGDGEITGKIIQRKAYTKRLSWEIDRNKAKSRQAKFIQAVLSRLNMEKIITEILEAPYWGFQVMELQWQKITLPGDSVEKLIPIKVEGKPSHWFRFDETNRLIFVGENNLNKKVIRSDDLNDQAVETPRKFLLAQHESTFINPYGKSLLRRAYWSWYIKTKILKIFAKHQERFGSPPLLGSYNSTLDNTQVKELLNLVSEMRSLGVYLFPEGTSVEALSVDTKAFAEAFILLLNYAREDISISILGQNFTANKSATGSYSQTDAGSDIVKAISDTDRKIVEQTIQELITWLIDLNFGPQIEYPRFMLYDRDFVDTEKAKFLETMTRAGYKFSKVWIEENMQIPAEQLIEIVPSQTQQANFEMDAPEPMREVSQKRLSSLLEAYENLSKKS